MSTSDKLFLSGVVWSAAAWVIYATPGTKFVPWAVAAMLGLVAAIGAGFA